MKNTHPLSGLMQIVDRPKKRLGRGHGSGKVKTSGRGQKGQKARDSIRPQFEGGQLALIKRLPFLRGKTRNKSRSKMVEVQVGVVNGLPKGTNVTLETLKKYHMIDERATVVKLIGDADVTVPVTVSVAVTKGARKAIEKAGGTVTV